MTIDTGHARTSRPRLLDAFACEGGATAGYQRAGFHVTAVDMDANRLKHNPADVKIVADAVGFIRDYGHEFHARHASPPCQRHTRGNVYRDTSRYPDLIGPTRDALRAVGGPYVLENVPDALPFLRDPVVLCGSGFDLTTFDYDGTLLHLQRHRLFETNWVLLPPGACTPHGCSIRGQIAGAYGGARRDKHEARHVRKGGYVPPAPVLRRLLGVPWMTQAGVFECLPPAYTEHIGAQLIRHLTTTWEGNRP